MTAIAAGRRNEKLPDVGRQNCVRQEIQAVKGTTAIDPCDINPLLWPHSSPASSRVSACSFALVTTLVLRSLYCASNWVSSTGKILAPDCECEFECFGFFSAESGQPGATPWLSRQTGNSCRLASSSFSFVLTPSISAKKHRQAKNRCRGSSSHPANGKRESHLGVLHQL